MSDFYPYLRAFYVAYLLIGVSMTLSAQDLPARTLVDPKTGCAAFFKHFFREDSMSWSGGCDNHLAHGYGTMTGYTDGVSTSSYTGEMRNGWMHGQGRFAFHNGQQLEGNFSEGELLNLGESYRERLHKHVVRTTDPFHLYVSDHDKRDLYYQLLLPADAIRGTLVLLPGTWETTEHVLSSTQKLCEYASDQHLAVVVLSVNQRLVLNESVLEIINVLLEDAINRYNLPREPFFMGGFSMGGLFSLRYTELAIQDKTKTAVVPKAVFSCDGPLDLHHLHDNFTTKLDSPHNGEAQYALREFEQYLGGSPATHREQYVRHSAYSHAEPDGGNARFLANVPTRIYCDVDPEWWIVHRGVDMYDLNALDQTAMIIRLQEMGNRQATFINAFGKGYRIEGYRHPHSWSIVDAVNCVDWLIGIQ